MHAIESMYVVRVCVLWCPSPGDNYITNFNIYIKLLICCEMSLAETIEYQRSMSLDGQNTKEEMLEY